MRKMKNSKFMMKSAAIALAAALCVPTVYTAQLTPMTVQAAVPTPTGVTATAENGKAILSWNPVSGAKMYAVYLKDAAGNVTLVHNRVSGTTYEVNGLKAGARYGFVVKAYTNEGWGGYSSTTWVTANIVSKAPENIKAVPGEGEVTVSWDPAYGAQLYAIFMKDSAGNVTLIHNRVEGTSYTVKGLRAGVSTGFIVKTYANRQWSGWSQTVWAAAKQSAPTVPAPKNFKSITVDRGQATLGWDAVSGADSYAVYQKQEDGSDMLIDVLQGETTITVYGLQNGVPSEFYVKACVGGVWSAASTVISVTPNDSFFPTLKKTNVYFNETIKPLSGCSVGDTVVFGTYEQDNNIGNGTEGIEWYVLAEQGGKVLLMSKYCLDVIPFHTVWDVVNWETSSLRSWMNFDFLSSSFTAAEQQKIVVTSLFNEKNIKFGQKDDNITQDRIFPLSYKELSSLFSLSSAGGFSFQKSAAVTEYAKSRAAGMPDLISDAQSFVKKYKTEPTDGHSGADYAGRGEWWMRTAGADEYSTMVIHFDGSMNFYGLGGWNANAFVRPAMWVIKE